MIKAVKLKGSSMNPFYKEGEFLLCETNFDADLLKVGDCAVYEMNGSLYLHIIEEKTKNGFYFGNMDDLPKHFVSSKQIKYIPVEKKLFKLFVCLILLPLRILKRFLIGR